MDKDVQTNKQHPEVETLSFKEASVELEQIVRSLESGELELEESLARYQRGVELLSSLRTRLATAQQQVETLLASNVAEASIDTTAAPSQAFIDE